MKLTDFTFFKDTPLIDFQNTIHFESNEERDDFFLNSGRYQRLTFTEPFNFIRDRSTIDLPIAYEQFRGVNYCTFLSEFEPDTRYYAYVMEYEYINDNNIRVYLLIDGIMTHTQGRRLNSLTNLTIEREHLTPFGYENRLDELKNNDDVLKTDTKRYFHEDEVIFDDFMVLIQSGVDLLRDFGDVNDPKITTSTGQRVDNLTSPLELYAVPYVEFNNLMSYLMEYAWISQNLKRLIMVPRELIEERLQPVTSEFSLSGFNNLYTVLNGRSNSEPIYNKLQDISYSMVELYQLFDLDPIQDRHLLRNEYTTTELYNWAGSQVQVDNGKLSEENGLRFNVNIVIGYHNEIAITLDGYMVSDPILEGSYLNNALIFNQFDDVPMLIDNYNLQLSRTANQRALNESKLLSNRVENILDPNAHLQDRFMDAASLISNFSVSSLFGKFTDEYEYYRTQKAEYADLALEAPTVSEQSHSNSFAIANNEMGVHVKFSKPSQTEMNKIKKYYKMFGYQVREDNARLSNVESMTVCNFVQFSGSWTLNNVDVAVNEMMKAQFENGVRLWHNTGSGNPMNVDVLENEMR